jgi:hypothetical protein
MQNKEETLPSMSPKRLAIIGGVLVTIIAIILIVTSLGGSKQASTSTAGKLETATVKAIQANINLNYVKEGEYAYSYENLIQESEPKDQTLLREYRDILKDFDYSVRGDGKAYQITYTNVDSEKIVLEGDYEKEFH